MLKMPDEFGGEVFWRFYPADGSQAITSAVEAAVRIAAEKDELRAEINSEESPFDQLIAPLRQAIAELAQQYKRLISAQDPGLLVRLVRNKLQNLKVEEAVPELTEKLRTWCGQPHPDDLLRREDNVQEAYKTLKVATTVEAIVETLENLWDALVKKGLDRPLPRPEAREPSERDLQLICWEWVIPESGKVGRTANKSLTDPTP